MKVQLYSGGLHSVGRSGAGRAIKHQKRALTLNHIEYTTDRNDSFDIAHINTIFPSSYFWAKKCRKNGKKVIYHAHSTREDFERSFMFSNMLAPLFQKWIVRCYNTADALITPTPYSKRLIEAYGIKKPIYALSNGIELDFFCYDEARAKEFRKQFGFSEDDKVIISVGLYIERKGILDFVELAKRMPEYKFVWFGYTPLYQVPRKVRKAVKTKLPNLFFPGYVEPEHFRNAYSGADLFLFPTYEETEGIVLLESLACRQNTLIRDIPIYESWLTDGVNVYKAKTLNEFEARIRGICEHTLPCLKDAGYELVSDKDLSQIGKQLLKIYESVLNEPQS